MDTDIDYVKLAEDVVRILENDPTEARKLYNSPDNLVAMFPPYDVAQIPLREAVRRAKGQIVPFTIKEYDSAMSRWATRHRKEQRDLQKKVDEFAKQQGIEAYFDGVMPKTEREFVALAMNKLGYTMTYDRRFSRSNEYMNQMAISNDLHLTAGELGMIKPHGNLLNTTLIDRAFQEWCEVCKNERKLLICEKLAKNIDKSKTAKIDIAFQQYCSFYFKEADFAEACIRKAIWQVKRKLFDLPVNQVHFFVVVGPQNAGKTWTTRKMFSVIDEVVAECSLQDALDDRQMDLPSMFVLFIDELARLDRVDSTSLKTFITGEGASRRPMRTNSAEKVRYNATLFATSNRSLDMLIYDNSGMRRYVEVFTKSRAEIEQDNRWDNYIVPFDWMTFWQSIDMHAEDPLISKFDKKLREKQEDIRSQSNVETWVRQFYYHINPPPKYTKEYGDGTRYQTNTDEGTHHRPETSSHERIEFWAEDLHHLFREYEDTFCRSTRPTIIQTWGKEMKSLIFNGELPDWDTHKVGHRTVYGWKPPKLGTQNDLMPVESKVQRFDDFKKKASML